jgi:N-formylglutamate amidohydrolase
LNSNPPDVDICIGYNDDDTCPNKVVIGNIVQYFKSLGYKVGINEPFSNSKTFTVPVKYNSVMIEVNKRLYMDEQTLEKAEGFEKLKQDIQSLYGTLLKD